MLSTLKGSDAMTRCQLGIEKMAGSVAKVRSKIQNKRALEDPYKRSVVDELELDA